MAASAFNGYGSSTGTCTVHSWNDGVDEDEAEPKMGLRVNQKLKVDPALYAAAPERRPTRLRGLRELRAAIFTEGDDE
jgi:WD repeat-containing protein 23